MSHVASTAEVYDSAEVFGSARIRRQTVLAWVDSVGSGNSITLHRIVQEDKEAWRINAGCKHFEDWTVAGVCKLVKQNLAASPPEWGHASAEERERWAKQVRAALKFLAASVIEGLPDDECAEAVQS